MNRQEQITISHSAILFSLQTGRFLTVKLLPESRCKTTIEFNLYGKRSENTAEMRLEVEKLKNRFESKIKELEDEHRKVLDGNLEFIDSRFLPSCLKTDKS
jgi:hypothetical protein